MLCLCSCSCSLLQGLQRLSHDQRLQQRLDRLNLVGQGAGQPGMSGQAWPQSAAATCRQWRTGLGPRAVEGFSLRAIMQRGSLRHFPVYPSWKRADATIRHPHGPSSWLQHPCGAPCSAQDVITMVGDGNCQFRTISQQLFDTQEHHPQVRQSVIKYMRYVHEVHEVQAVRKEPWEGAAAGGLGLRWG